jgi:hypothetical protein
MNEALKTLSNAWRYLERRHGSCSWACMNSPEHWAERDAQVKLALAFNEIAPAYLAIHNYKPEAL